MKAPKAPRLHATKAVLDRFGVHTVCQSARCPNIGECFGARTATFMILGNVCTRSCRFCAVPGGPPAPPEDSEPRRVAEAARQLGLEHVVVTSVTRDDLPDGGASHFARTVAEVRALLPQATVEVLTPDFGGDEEAVRTVCDAAPDVYNHNVETVPRLYSRVRPQADYRRSLDLLVSVRTRLPTAVTKSGLMVGLGEVMAEVLGVLSDLRRIECDMLTIGQYLRPSPRHLPVSRYVPPGEFEFCQRAAEQMGFRYVASGPFVRSSYHAAAGVAGLCDGGGDEPS